MYSLIKTTHRLLLLFLRHVMVTFFLIAFFLYIFQTSSRIFLKETFFSLDALINYLFVLAALSGAIYNIHLGDNISISLLQKIGKHPIVQLIIDTVSFAISLVMLYIFFLYTVDYTESMVALIKSVPYVFLFFVACLSYSLNMVKSIQLLK